MDIFGNFIYKYIFLWVLVETGLAKIVFIGDLSYTQKLYQIGVFALVGLFITILVIALENIFKMRELSVLHLLLFLFSGSVFFWVTQIMDPSLRLEVSNGLNYLVYVVFGFFFSTYRRR